MEYSKSFYRRAVLLFGVCMVTVMFTGCRHIAPIPSAPTVPPPPIPDSHVSLTVGVPISLPQDAINNAIPSHEDADDNTVSINGGADNCGKGISVGYHVRRTPIVLGGSGNTLTAQTEVTYNVEGRAREKLLFGVCAPGLLYASCGRGEPEPQLAIGISVSVAGVDPNWNPLITLNPASVATQGECKLTKLNIHVENNIADLVRNAINGQDGNAQNAASASLGLPAKAQQGWALLEKPIAVSQSTWLSIHPKQVGILPFNVTPTLIQAGVGIVADPVLSVSATAPAADTEPLPSPSPFPASNNFFVELPVETDNAVVQKQLEDILKIHQGGIRYPPTGGNYLTVTGVTISSYGQEAVIRLDLKVHGIFGPKAVVYLTGTPAFDSAQNVLSFPDLAFTVESHNILLEIAKWLTENALRDDLRAKARLDISAQVQAAKAQMSSAINQDLGPMKLSGTVDNLTILGVYTSPQDGKFRAVLQTSGTLGATLK